MPNTDECIENFIVEPLARRVHDERRPRISRQAH